VTAEAALNAKLDDHLGDNKHQPSDADNSHTGSCNKLLKAEDASFRSPRVFEWEVLSLSVSRTLRVNNLFLKSDIKHNKNGPILAAVKSFWLVIQIQLSIKKA